MTVVDTVQPTINIDITTVAARCECCDSDCPGCCPKTPGWTAYLTGTPTNFGGDGCPTVTGPYPMVWLEDAIFEGVCVRIWQGEFPWGPGVVDCVAAGEGGSVLAQMQCAAGAYNLSILTGDFVNGLATYTHTGTWHCDECNDFTFTGTGSTPCCDFTGVTITVCPDGVTPSAPRPMMAASPRRKALPCVHVGEAAGPKGWHVCEHPDEPLGAIVCSCKGCGKKCPGYTAEV